MFERIIKSEPFKSAARKTGNVVKVTLLVYFVPIIISVAPDSGDTRMVLYLSDCYVVFDLSIFEMVN